MAVAEDEKTVRKQENKNDNKRKPRMEPDTDGQIKGAVPSSASLDALKAPEYWNSKPSTVDAVLGGFEHVSPLDIDTSEAFLASLGILPLESGATRVGLDTGAGIGRVSKELLIGRKLLSSVDACEPCKNFIPELKKIPEMDQVFEVSLQEFTPCPNKYNVIWNQWVLLYLSDQGLVDFLVRCKAALLPGGIICAKENVIIGARGKPELDDEDGSVTRTVRGYRDVFKQAGLEIIAEQRQTPWPDNLHAVMMFAARPAAAAAADGAAAQPAAGLATRKRARGGQLEK